jgi:hypothetical protein
MTRDQAAEFRAQLGEIRHQLLGLRAHMSDMRQAALVRLELTHAIDAIAAIDYLPDHEIEKIPVGDRFCRR